MTFYEFMMKNHKEKDTPEGDLAHDMSCMCNSFPRNCETRFDMWYYKILDFLKQNHACDACIEVFEECWGDYVLYEKNATTDRDGAIECLKNAKKLIDDFIPENEQSEISLTIDCVIDMLKEQQNIFRRKADKRANQDIRCYANKKGVLLWEVAQKLGYTDGYFSKKLRTEMSRTEKQFIREIIDGIAEQKHAEGR
jgi:uncharacterized protein YozE (UPF0346 family)